MKAKKAPKQAVLALSPDGVLPMHPVTEIHNIQLEEFEAAVYRKDRELATRLLLENLRKLKTGAAFVGYKMDFEVLQILYTRFCAAVITLLADPEYFLHEDGLALLAGEHGTMDLVFRASIFNTSDHLLPLITMDPTEREQAKIVFQDPGSLLKYLTTYSLRSMFALNFEETFKRAPELLFPLWLGMLSHLLTINPRAQAQLEKLMGLHDVFADVPLHDAALTTLSDVYMYTSYSTRDDRHETKKTLIRVLARMMQEKVPNLPSPERFIAQRKKQPKKPTIVILLDWYTSLHAMYRCWSPVIQQLRGDFKLVAFSQASSVDAVSKKDFDAWHCIPNEHVSFDTLIDDVLAVKPDIVYYPSIGMSPWFVALASVRLAPIQIMTLGHPATSGSEVIDYVIGDQGTFTDHALFTERIVELPTGGLFNFVMRPDAIFPPVQEKARCPETVRIAVPSMLCKLNAKFMAVVKRIQTEAKTPTEFHFFANMIGLTMHQTARELREWSPNSKIYERMDYNTYIRFLQTCDLHLSTFPFGGTNSNIDSMKLGLPLVCLEGKEPFERFDAVMMRKVGLPEWTIAQSEDEYVAAAVRLIDDHAEREVQREQLLSTNLEALFFRPCGEQHFLKAVQHIYENHEMLTNERWIKV